MKADTLNNIDKVNISNRINNKHIIDKVFEPKLIQLLRNADEGFRPTKKKRQDGSIYYTYKRNKFERSLTSKQIEKLISNPTSYEIYRNYIKTILTKLKSIGVIVVLNSKDMTERAGTWIPEKKIVELNYSSVKEGSKNFARQLNHEVIHIVQYCKSGSIHANPELIGLNTNISRQIAETLKSDIYKNMEQQYFDLEVEAYSNQHNLRLGSKMLDIFCK